MTRPSAIVSGRLFRAFALLAVVAAAPAEAHTAEPSYQPPVAAASDEGELAIRGFRLPEGVKADLFAAEPLTANPVAICLDEQGRLYVAESYRQEEGIEDNRFHMNWLKDDLALQTVEDRLAMFKKYLGPKIETYDDHHDLIRLLEDSDGDGHADRSTVFADGFNGILDGTGAGILARRGDVYYTCIPELWRLRDTNGDGKADERDSLHHGYGVRVAFRGHDSHGLRFGPDGRLYFSIGDRGFNIQTPEGRRLAKPDTGAVFRCNPDGSELEVFASGLRNPQELAFDEYGNLFTGDNNSDGGDKARWVYVVEGGDTGWRMYYQYLKDRGPWNREKLWHPQHDGQAAYIIPPIDNLGDGPSGLVYYPGVGLPERYNGHFFMCDFRGAAGTSGIRSFAVKPRGATFELVDSHEYVWSMLGTDVDFSFDGRMFVSDWVHGWTGLGKGRIYTFRDSNYAQDAVAAGGTQLMAEGFTQRSSDELAKLMSHSDIRIRQEAQFALAERSDALTLAKLVSPTLNRLTRLHAIWGLGQIGRRTPSTLEGVMLLLSDRDAEVRAQAAKVLGEARAEFATGRLIGLLRDKEPRVRFFAALSLGKLANPAAIDPLLNVLAENNDTDPMLRHAAVMGLAGANNVQALLAKANHPNQAARMGIVLALRKLEAPEITRFLDDSQPSIVLEAARAIHDVPISAAMPQLAALAGRRGLPDPLLRRVLSANYRNGTPANIEAVARIAADASLAEELRLEALEELKTWGDPTPLDRVLGAWRPIEKRSAEPVTAALSAAWGSLFSGPDKVRRAAAQLAATYGVRDVGPMLFELLKNQDREGTVRVEALAALHSLKDAQSGAAVELAIADENPLVRAEGRRLLAASDPERAIPLLDTAIGADVPAVERQNALSALANLKSPNADAVIERWLDQLQRGEVPAEIQLDLIEAAKVRNTPGMQQRLSKFEASRDANDPLSPFRETVAGGQAERGSEIFLTRSEVSCLRCHKIDGRGGEVGPDLSKIGSEKTREYLLESLVLPSKQIAKNFETTSLAMTDGTLRVGLIKSEDEEHLTLLTAEGNLITVLKSEIDDRGAGKSAMPDDVMKHLSKSDVRDLVEFLATRTGK